MRVHAFPVNNHYTSPSFNVTIKNNVTTQVKLVMKQEHIPAISHEGVLELRDKIKRLYNLLVCGTYIRSFIYNVELDYCSYYT